MDFPQTPEKMLYVVLTEDFDSRQPYNERAWHVVKLIGEQTTKFVLDTKYGSSIYVFDLVTGKKINSLIFGQVYYDDVLTEVEVVSNFYQYEYFALRIRIPKAVESLVLGTKTFDEVLTLGIQVILEDKPWYFNFRPYGWGKRTSWLTTPITSRKFWFNYVYTKKYRNLWDAICFNIKET